MKLTTLALILSYDQYSLILKCINMIQICSELKKVPTINSQILLATFVDNWPRPMEKEFGNQIGLFPWVWRVATHRFIHVAAV